MPAGNTNILKEYISRYDSIIQMYNEEKNAIENSEWQDSEGIYSMEIQLDDLHSLSEECSKFINDLRLVLRVNQQKNEEKYIEMIESIEEKKGMIGEAENRLRDLLHNAGMYLLSIILTTIIHPILQIYYKFDFFSNFWRCLATE